MTRILTEGFEMGDLVGMSGGANCVVSSAQKRTGNYAAYCPDASDSHLNVPLPQTVTEAYIRFAAYITDFGSTQELLRVYSGSGNLHLTLNASGSGLRLERYADEFLANGSTALQTNTWYVFEARVIINDTTGVFQLRIDGGPSLDIDYTGDTRGTAGSADIRTFRFMGYLQNHGYIDDIAVNDTAGSTDNSWPGLGGVIYLPASADGSPNEWTCSTGSDHYALVDDVPADGDTTYLYTSTDAKVEEFDVADTAFDDVPVILRVWPEARVRRVDADSLATVQLGVTSGATTDYSDDLEPLTSYTKRIIGDVHTVNPATSQAWTVDELDAVKVLLRSTIPVCE
jgi:hypothetical protein